MKKHILFLFALACVSVTAQNISLKKANRYFENHAYSKAIEGYSNKDKSQEVLQNLADCYYYTLNYEKAISTYEELTTSYGEIQDTKRLFRYAQALKATNNYEKADQFFETLFWQNF